MCTELGLKLEPKDVKAGLVPIFFPERWREMQKVVKGFVTEHDYDPMKDYAYEAKLKIGLGMFLLSILFIISVLVVVYPVISGIFGGSCGLPSVWTDKENYWVIGACMISCMVVCVIALLCFNYLNSLTPAKDRNGHQCFQEISHLFFLFNIPLCKGMDPMSFEEFRADIEDSLRRKAISVDAACSSFSGQMLRSQFNEMHRVALFWGLCHENRARYYSTKEEAKK